MFGRASTVLLGLLLSTACVDPPIVTLMAATADASNPPSDGGSVSDGDSSAGGHLEGGFELAVCKACLTAPEMPGPGCASAYFPCVGSPKCDELIACALDACVGGASSAFITCAFACAQEAGVLASNDPSLTLATGLYSCFINGACTPACFTK